MANKLRKVHSSGNLLGSNWKVSGVVNETGASN
jgi:hypothetical protein